MLHSYSSIYSIGHKAVKDIFNTEVLIEEKIDGSQFSFGKKDGVLFMRSKGATIYEPVADKLFKGAADYITSIQSQLQEGYTYRGEVLSKTKHNTLQYARVPKHNVIIFDVDKADQDYLTSEEKRTEAERLDLETVPVFFQGKIKTYEQLKSLFDTTSILGDAKVEGMVFKNYAMYGPDKKVLMAKWVSEVFKEVHNSEWSKANPTRSDLTTMIVRDLKTDARWEKVIQHLRDDGRLENSPRDIGVLLKEIHNDVEKEMGDDVKDRLFAYYWPQIVRGITAGFPEYYKQRLAKSQFESQETINVQ